MKTIVLNIILSGVLRLLNSRVWCTCKREVEVDLKEMFTDPLKQG